MMKFYSYIGIIAALTLGSCATEPDVSIPVGGEDKSVRFSLRVSSADGSRALVEADENAIHTVDVLAFYRDDLGVYRYAYAATDIRHSQQTVTATVKGYPGPQRFVILVNGSSEFSSAGIGLNEPLDQAVRKLVCTRGAEGQWNAKNNGSGIFDPIPMYAKTDPVVVDGNKQIGPYALIRMLARIDVRVGSGVSGFKLTDARLFNQKTAGYVAYDFSDFAADRAHTAAVPAANTNSGDPILSGSVAYEADADGVIERSIYAYESPAYGESGRLTGTAIVIGGEWNGTAGFYRVDLRTTDESDPSLLSGHILRNHLYRVVIQSVSGVGYGTPEEAYLGGSRLTATVTDWDLARQEVIDGRWSLWLDADSWECPAEGGDVVIIALSNYNVDWQGFPPGVQVDESKIIYTPAVAPGEEWIDIQNVSGANGSIMRNFKIVASVNPTRKKRSAKVYVTVGNLSKAIHVSQGYNAPTWTGTSNCYMIRTGDTAPLSIPMTQVLVAMGSSANAVNGFLGTGWITDYTKLKAQVLWSDVNRFGTETSVVHSASYIGAEVFSDSEIVVVPGVQEGNSAVILYQDNDGNGSYTSGDKIIWSWHIWNTHYHPYNEDGTPNGKMTGNQSLTNELWMDRNLGATSNNIENLTTSRGFLYQWGRKDPFSGSLSRHYNGVKVTATTSAPTGPNLLLSVSNPATYYTNSSYTTGDWYATSTANQNHNIWGGGAQTDFLHAEVNGYRKSVYDPCPDGYRLPRDEDWSKYTAWTYVSNGRYHNDYGGYYPYGAKIATGGSLDATGFGFYWSATPDNKYPGRGSSINVPQSADVSDGGEYRAAGYSVRCRAQ